MSTAEQRQPDPDGLAKLLAFRYAVPPVRTEGSWRELPYEQRQYWRDEATMVGGYLVHGAGWQAPS